MNDLKRRTSGIRKAMAQGQGRLVVAGALVALLFAAVGVYHTGNRVEGVKAGYELSKVEAEYRALLRENEHLKMERAMLRSPQRLETIAHARLGLTAPAPTQIVPMPAAPNAAPPADPDSRTVAQLGREAKARTGRP